MINGLLFAGLAVLAALVLWVHVGVNYIWPWVRYRARVVSEQRADGGEWYRLERRYTNEQATVITCAVLAVIPVAVVVVIWAINTWVLS